MIDFDKDWISIRVSIESGQSLMTMLDDIRSFRKTGVLRDDSTLRVIDREFTAQFSTDSNLRLVENAVLYEISRRWYNEHEY